MHEREHAAARSASEDAFQPRHCALAESRRQSGDDEEVILLRHAAGLFVVFGDRCVFVAQVHLDDLLDMLVELLKAFFDVIALRPDAAIDQSGLVIGEMHQTGKVLAKADGVDNGEVRLAGRCGLQDAEDEAVHHLRHPLAAVVIRFDEQRGFLRKGQRERQRKVLVAREAQRSIFG